MRMPKKNLWAIFKEIMTVEGGMTGLNSLADASSRSYPIHNPSGPSSFHDRGRF
jgi:hypothetical protein